MTQPTMARGAADVRVGVMKYLHDALPAVRNRALQAWGLKGSDLPEIRIYNPYGNTALESNSGPVVGANVRRVNRFQRVDMTALAEEEYQVTYAVTLVLFCFSLDDDAGRPIGNPRNIATRVRDDLMSLIRHTLLDRPSLGTEYFYLEQSTLVEEYADADPVPNSSQRYYASGSITFDLKVDEKQLRKALGNTNLPIDITVEGVVDNAMRDVNTSHAVGELP